MIAPDPGATRGSQSHRARDDLARAEAARAGANDGLTFGSVRHTMAFYFCRGAAMQAPLGNHPRGETDKNGDTVYITVDGGRGGSIDEVHAVLQSIRQAMEALYPDRLAHDMAVAYYKAGMDEVSLKDLSERFGMAPSTCSVHLGRAQAFLAGWLRARGIIYGAGIK